jgi:hypothetical protein
MFTRPSFFLTLLLVGFGAVPCYAQGVLWNETTQGDLSTNPAAPNQFSVGVGTNSIIGSVFNPNDPRDFVTLNLTSSQALSNVILFSYTSADAIGFIGVQAGTSFQGSLTDPASYLGYSHFGTATVGVDHLPMMGTADGAQGFTPPLPAGSYTFVIQQTGTNQSSYQWDFVISSVPEPAAWLLAPVAVALFGLWRWRTRRSSLVLNQ